MAGKNLFHFNYELDLPPQDRFPINESLQDRKVNDVLLKDIRRSTNYLILTGFTSLAHLITVFGSDDFPKLDKVKILIGYDPDERVGQNLPFISLPIQIRNYWIKQNVSIRLCGPVINLIEKIKEQKVTFKVKNKFHGKLYVGDDAAILGSSNFSKSGTLTQTEVNIRVSRNGDDTESEQFASIKKLAEYYYEQGEDYDKAAIELLHKILKDATWQEALARGLAEILESKWMKDYPVLSNVIGGQHLWPSQKSGIAKAMKIIQDQGRVLIADPTGSGKTKFATALAYTMFHWLWENGLKDRSSALVITPAQVLDNWEREQEHFKITNKIYSMQKLSMGKQITKQYLQKEIENRDILIIDEAHNFLRASSLRSKSINPRAATNIILSTATPINKKADDLLRLVELLDIDNLNDTDLQKFKQLKKNRWKLNDSINLDSLRDYINLFIVRRTKKELNQMIDKEPELYTNRNHRPCRYPRAISDVYQTGETENDKTIAMKIRDLAMQLKGIHYLQKWGFPRYIKTVADKKLYIDQRFLSANALSAFMVRSCLRSSNCAVMEYLMGTKYANELYKIESAKDPTGNRIEKVEQLKDSFEKIKFPAEFLNDQNNWISNKEDYIKQCDIEISIYTQIAGLVTELSGRREMQKAKTILRMREQYGKVLAFDSKLITLEYIEKLILDLNGNAKTIVATGSTQKNKTLVKELFGLQTSYKEPLIALCSDAMAEGINLPDAKALVLLDMPSVLRLIEQRIGRIERMDSEHEEIHVFWPDDSEAFSLKGDKRMVDILVITEKLIRSNVEVPNAVYARYVKESDTTKEFIKKIEEYNEKELKWEGIKDNTYALQSLYEGQDALIKAELYNEFLGVDATVKSAISFVESESTFSFFAFRGDVSRSPKWLFIDERNQSFTDFSVIAEKLKQHLTDQSLIQRKWNEVDV